MASDKLLKLEMNLAFNPLTTFGRTRNMKINLELGVR